MEVEVTPNERVELEYFEVNLYNSTSQNRNLDLLVIIRVRCVLGIISLLYTILGFLRLLMNLYI